MINYPTLQSFESAKIVFVRLNFQFISYSEKLKCMSFLVKICFSFNIRYIDFEFVLISDSATSKTFRFK